jgi:hypothetical protein
METRIRTHYDYGLNTAHVQPLKAPMTKQRLFVTAPIQRHPPPVKICWYCQETFQPLGYRQNAKASSCGAAWPRARRRGGCSRRSSGSGTCPQHRQAQPPGVTSPSSWRAGEAWGWGDRASGAGIRPVADPKEGDSITPNWMTWTDSDNLDARRRPRAGHSRAPA